MGMAGDWDPLPPETLDESEDPEVLARRRAEAERRAAQEDGERRLREMIAEADRTRVHPMGQALSKVSERLDRREAAARAPFADESRHRTSFVQAIDVPLDPEWDEGRDPREDESWFRKLPPDTQQQYRERWEWERRRFDPIAAKNRRRLLVSMGEGAGLFVVVDLLIGAFLGWLLIHGLVMAIAGAACGLLWQLLRADRFAHSIMSLPVYFVAHVAVLGTWNPFRLCFGALVLAHAAAYRGLRVEHRKLEGTW